MHSSDRTLLASLGFADPDKKDKRHTLACQYLAQAAVLSKVIQHIQPVGLSGELAMTDAEVVRLSGAPASPPPFDLVDKRLLAGIYGGHTSPKYRTVGSPVDLSCSDGQIECAMRRRGGYLVGFWDVVATAKAKKPYIEVVDTYGGNPLVHQRRAVSVEWATWSIGVAIEVKAGVADVADCARQMELYMGEPFPLRESSPDVILCVLATLYPLSELDKATLFRKKIRHIYLGAPFQKWCEDQPKAETKTRVEF